MINVGTAYAELPASADAGRTLGEKLREDLGGPADAVIAFASARYDARELLSALKAASGTPVLMGCSSAGEFISGQAGDAAASAIAFRTDEMLFRASVGRGLRTDRSGAAHQLVAGLRGRAGGFPHRTLLMLADALAGNIDELIEEFNALSGGAYQIFGGGAGDDVRFRTTHIFHGEDVFTDAAVALEILSVKPLGIGVQHGWEPVGDLVRVTEADGMRLISLNSAPAIEVFERFAASSGQRFDRAEPLSFFLHNTIGIWVPDGFKIRVPLAVEPDGSIICASNVPRGALVSLMRATARSSAEAAVTAARAAVAQLDGNRPKAALFFDCVATRLRMGGEFGFELDSLQRELGERVRYAGCNSYGQVARVAGQFSGFHNCTAVVCVVPE